MHTGPDSTFLRLLSVFVVCRLITLACVHAETANSCYWKEKGKKGSVFVHGHWWSVASYLVSCYGCLPDAMFATRFMHPVLHIKRKLSYFG